VKYALVMLLRYQEWKMMPLWSVHLEIAFLVPHSRHFNVMILECISYMWLGTTIWNARYRTGILPHITKGGLDPQPGRVV
jgi:hypothetical protein